MGIGQIQARLEVCKTCDRYVRRAGWNWYRCEECGVDKNGHAIQDLDSAYRDGPESNCPLGKWAGIVGPTDEQLAAQAETEKRQMVTEWIERMDPFLQKLSDEEIVVALDAVVVGGYMPQENCDRIKAELEKAPHEL